MKQRHILLVLLAPLSATTFLDRFCIAVAGPQIQGALNISPERWGWVLGALILSYGLFEIRPARSATAGASAACSPASCWVVHVYGAYGTAWAICLDSAGRHADAVTGAIKTVGQAGGFLFTIVFPYVVGYFHDYNLPLFIIAFMLLFSVVLFHRIDPAGPLWAGISRGAGPGF